MLKTSSCGKFPTAALKTLGLLLAIHSAVQAQTGSILGTLKDEKGLAIAGAVVAATLQSPSAANVASTESLKIFLPFPAKAVTGAGGEFEIDNLPAGTFQVCADKAGAELLNPCLWSAQPPVVTAAPNVAVNGTQVVAPHGVTLVVRVNDSGGAIATRPVLDDVVVAAQHGGSPLIPARVLARDTTGKTVGVVVPAGAAVSLSIQSSRFTLADAQGKTLAPSAVVPVTAPTVSAVDAANVTIQITGKATQAAVK